jgi:hypothetical protein
VSRHRSGARLCSAQRNQLQQRERFNEHRMTGFVVRLRLVCEVVGDEQPIGIKVIT